MNFSIYKKISFHFEQHTRIRCINKKTETTLRAPVLSLLINNVDQKKQSETKFKREIENVKNKNRKKTNFIRPIYGLDDTFNQTIIHCKMKLLR